MNYELLYTSAPGGLKPGSRGFCTVVATRNIPTNLSQKLESISGYRPIYAPSDAHASKNPVCYSHVRFAIGGKNVSVISRVAAYGLDYSQRSNKIAHHVALYDNPPACGPVPLLKSSSVMRSDWDGKCRSLGSDPELPNFPLATVPCQRWQTMTGDAGWAGVLAAAWLQPAAKPIWIVFGEDQSPQLLDLMLEATALLPAKARWSATFSTYFTNLPPDAECRVRCVLVESEEAKAAKSRGVVLDLTAPMPPATDSPEVQAARAGTLVGAPETSETPPRQSPKPKPKPALSPTQTKSLETSFDLEDIPDPVPPSPKFIEQPADQASTAQATITQPTATQATLASSSPYVPAQSPYAPAQPPQISDRHKPKTKPSAPWFILAFMTIALALVGCAVYFAAAALDPLKKVAGEPKAGVADGDDIDASVFAQPKAEGPNDPPNPKIDLAKENQPRVGQNVPPADEPPVPVLQTLHPRIQLYQINEDREITDSIEFNETQMRDTLDLARIKFVDMGKLQITDYVTDLDKGHFDLIDDILRWRGDKDFRAKPNNGGWPVKIIFTNGMEKNFTLVVKQESDPDIVMKLKPTTEPLGNILVAGMQIEADLTEDLDETGDLQQRKKTRRFFWERQEYVPLAPSAADQPPEEFQDSGIEVPLPVPAVENWKLISGANSDRYVVSPEDYGHELHCILFYHEASGGEKRVISKPIRCVSVPVLEYSLADFFDKPPDKIMGAIQWDLASLKKFVPANASWQLNGNKIIPTAENSFVPFSLDSVIPANTAPLKAWAVAIQESRRNVSSAMAALHEMLSKGFTDALIPPESELSQSYLNNTNGSIDPMDYSGRIAPLNTLHRKVLKFGELAALESKNESQSAELAALEKDLITGNLFYLADPKNVSKDLSTPQSRRDFLLKFYRFFEQRASFKKKLGPKQTDAITALDTLKKALATPIALAPADQHPLTMSMRVPLESGLPGASSELASFPIALKLHIIPDERYAKYLSSPQP